LLEFAADGIVICSEGELQGAWKLEAFVAEPDCKFVQPFDQIVGRKRRSGRIIERLAPRREMVIKEFKEPTTGGEGLSHLEFLDGEERLPASYRHPQTS
jgi:hypothetical protein